VFLSIIVPAFNEERLLATSLRAIHDAAAVLTRRGWTWELIVCDNNSSDDTARIARDAGARVVFEPVNQISRARNTGAAAACGDWLLFIDADSQPGPALFEDMAATIAAGRTLAGGATIRMEHIPWLARCGTRLWNLASRCRKLPAGSFIFVETDAFRSIGGFSEEWFAAEEIELTSRLRTLARQRGKQIVILHRHPLTTSGRKTWLYGPWEILRLLWRAAASGGKSLRNPQNAHLWYDGRR
jgi:glycosyltransferase involved in cell wall biosynthesis